MSRGYDVDERDDSPQSPAIPEETRERDAGNRPVDRSAAQPPASGRTRQADIRAMERWYALGTRERETLKEVGRFRTIAADDLLKHQYQGKTEAFRREIFDLQKQGLLRRRSISVGKNRDTLVIVSLTKKGAHLVRQDHQLPEKQAIYAGFVKPAEVPHDAAIYQMYQAEAGEIASKGGKIRRVVLDYEFKREVYSRLARGRDDGAVDYARRQKEVAEEHRLPVVDGKIALPDLRIEYETPEGDLSRVDLELATEHYHRGHMSAKARAGFKMYGFVSTSRGRRAQWEGRELSATVLSL